MLCAVLRDILSLEAFSNQKPYLAQRVCEIRRAQSTAIELGSGTGLVGLQFAHSLLRTNMLLTDLASAQDILDQNIQAATLLEGQAVECCVLDWEEELPLNVLKRSFDLILVSECTYNADSIPALVRTIRRLFGCSANPLLVIGTKIRHESEAAFHQCLAEMDIRQVEHLSFPLPDMQRTLFGLGLETLEVFAYEKAETFPE